MAAHHTVQPAIGARIPRRELKRLLSGHGRYIDDIKLPRMLHACFRAQPAPARAKSSRSTLPRPSSATGVVAVFTAAEINPRCEPFVAVALHRPGHRSPPQPLFAADRAVWQGQPVAVVVAESRARGRGRRRARRHRLGAAARGRAIRSQAIAPGAPAIHPELGDNIAFDFSMEKGEPGQGFRRGRPRDRGRASLRAADGDDARNARADRRLQSGRRLADRHPCASVAVPDAGDVQPASGHSGASCPSDGARHRRRRSA